MNRKGIIIAILLLSALLAACSGQEPESAGNAAVDASITLEMKSSGTTEQGDVAIDLTPKIVGDSLEVDIAANTHSVNLGGYDLMEKMVLEINGKRLNPVSAPSLGGHHSGGTVIFDIRENSPDEFNIIIEGIPAIEERKYSWKR